jgi:hypothetical protein
MEVLTAEPEKRIKTLSKNGNWYLKNPTERNRLGQKAHYDKCADTIKPLLTLKRLAVKGMCPRLSSYNKYPEYINRKELLTAYKLYKDTKPEPDVLYSLKDKIYVLIDKIDELEKNK